MPGTPRKIFFSKNSDLAKSFQIYSKVTTKNIFEKILKLKAQYVFMSDKVAWTKIKLQQI